MPYIVSGAANNSISKALADIDNAEFKYDYPAGLKLKPGSELHNKIVDEVMRRARESYEAISSRHPSWRRMDQVNTSYKYVDETEEKVQDKDERKPVSILFPYTYAVRETLLTYLITAFFQDPLFTYEGVGDDDVVGAKLLTLLVRMHCMRNKIPLALHTMFGDSLSYGIGPVSPGWTRRRGSRIKEVTGSAFDIEGTEVAGESIKEYVKGIVFEGNDLENIDPYRYLPDPNVASHKIQDGEYLGWWRQSDYMKLLNEESTDKGCFNVRYLKLLKNKLSFLSGDPSDRNKKENRPDLRSSTNTNKIDVIPMYIDLIPSEWGLGKGEYPEKWWFEVAADSIVIRAEQMQQHHGMFPVAVACPDFDGYTATPISRLETLYGLQHTLDWLFNSHIANVRKAINDMIVYDPWMINTNDVKDPKAGKLIRTRRPSWGKGRVTDYISQLGITDITRSHLADSNYIAEWMQRLVAADDSMMGMTRTSGPDRLTGQEFQGTRGSALSRLQRLSMMISLQAMQDIGFFFASHAQQYITKETYVQVLGDLPEKLAAEYAGGKTRIKVSPSDLYIEYDVIPRDGSIPGGNFSDSWIQLFNIIGTDPELRQMFDVPRIFIHIARELGAKNVEDFRKAISLTKPKVVPDEVIEKEVDKGNIIPTGA